MSGEMRLWSGRSALVVLVIALGAVSLLAAGCGDDEDSGTAAAAGDGAVSKAEFLERANAICRRERADLEERIADFEEKRGGRPPEPYSDMVHWVLLAAIEEELGAIEELPMPPGQEEAIDIVLSSAESALGNAATREQVPSVAALERLFVDPARSYRDYGLTACAVDAEGLGLNS